MADTVIENLIAKLTFDFDEDQLAAFDEGIEKASKGMLAVIAAAGAAAVAIFAFTKEIAKTNDELGKTAERIGVDVVALQELGYVAELNGSSIDSMSSSLGNLGKIASEASRGMGAGVEAFGILGISVTDAQGRLKNTDDLLLDVSDSIARLGSQAEKIEFASKLGISDDLLLTIQNGSDAIRRQREEAKALGFAIDQQAAKAAADYNDEMLKIEKVVSGVASAIGTRLMKQSVPMMKMFVEWFKINKALIQQNLSMFLDRAITVIRGVFNIVMRVVGVITSLVNLMGGWKNAIIAVTAVLIALNATALLMPVLITAAAIAIFLLLEDLVKFAEGGDSAIGKLAERFPVLDTALRATLKLISMIRDGWVMLATQSGEALEGLIFMLQDVGKAVIDFLLAPINKAIDLVNKIPGVDIGTNVERQQTGGIAGSLIASAAKTAQERVTSPGGLFGQGGQVNNTSAKTVNNNNTINVNGGDTEQVKQAVKEAISEEYSGAETNLSTQVEV